MMDHLTRLQARREALLLAIEQAQDANDTEDLARADAALRAFEADGSQRLLTDLIIARMREQTHIARLLEDAAALLGQ